MLQHFVEFLHCPIRLWMIRGTLLMLYLKLLCQRIDGVIDEVTPLITHQYLSTTKLGNNIVEQEHRCCRNGAI